MSGIDNDTPHLKQQKPTSQKEGELRTCIIMHPIPDSVSQSTGLDRFRVPQ